MQNLAKDEAGNVWEIDAQGNAVRMVTPAVPTTGRVFSLPPNPKDIAVQEDRDADNARAERSAAVEERRLALAEQAAAREAAKASGKPGGDAKAAARIPKLNALVEQIKRVEELYSQNIAPEDAGLLSSLGDYLPTQENKQFDTASAGLAEQGLAAFRVPGVGAQSDTELRQFVQANKPSASDYDVSIEEKLRQLKSRVDEERRGMGLEPVNWADQRADNEVPNPDNGAALKPPPPGLVDPGSNSPGGGPRMEVATGDSRRVFDERMSSTLNALINSGRSKAFIDAVMGKEGYSALTPQDWSAIQKFRKENPGQQFFGAKAVTEEPTTALQRASASPLASFVAHAGNSVAAGIPGALAGPEGQGALDAMSALNPKSSFGGGVVGSTAGMIGAEAALAARLGAKAIPHAGRLADLGFGSLTGFNQAQEGEGLSGALTGGGAALLGGEIGRKVMSGAGRLARGVQDPNVRALRAMGIPTTTGQTVGNSGIIGQAVKKTEDALTSLPLVGNMVDARRMEGIRGFNKAAFDVAADQVGGGVTDTGSEGIGQLRQIIGQAYDNALTPARIDPTEGQFGADLMAAIDTASAIPDVNGAQGAALSALESRIMGAVDPATGEIPGRGFQEAYRGLARTGRERASSDYGHEVGGAMREGQDVLSGALERQNPGAFEAFRAANSTNRRANVLAEAVNKAKNAEDELFTPAQLNMADTLSARRLTGPMASAAGERPFHDLATAGQAVLPSALPDSGTWTRALVGGGATGVLGGGGALVGGSEGATTGTGIGLGAMLTLAIGGSKPAQKALTAALVDRPDMAKRFGAMLLENARYGGAAGAGTGLAYTGN